jgi:ABC-type branched-subunit amino acid transport system substrate-binding protein
VGLFFDYAQPDGGAYHQAGVELGLTTITGLDEVLGEPLELLCRDANGLPAGSEAEVADGFRSFVAEDLTAVIGPSISDNAMVVTPIADELEIPCINYTGGAHTRSRWVFHYQVGSLEEEPAVIAAHLRAIGLDRVAVVYDESAVGRGYLDFFRAAGAHVVQAAAISALSTDLVAVLTDLRASEPDALVYFGLGVASRAVALAVTELAWGVPVVANSSLMFGYARPDWRAGYEGWAYVDTISDGNRARTALRDGLERVKRLPATSGKDGTLMGFGPWDHGALKGEFLVLRSWVGGRSTEVAGG